MRNFENSEIIQKAAKPYAVPVFNGNKGYILFSLFFLRVNKREVLSYKAFNKNLTFSCLNVGEDFFLEAHEDIGVLDSPT